MATQLEQCQIISLASERDQFVVLDQLLHTAHEAKLVVGGETAAELPDTVVALLQQMLRILASGQMVTLVPGDKVLTTQEASDILNVSRPYVVKLLEEGHIPFSKTGVHRRIRFDDLIAYKERRDAKRHADLVEITRLGEELDELDEDEA